MSDVSLGKNPSATHHSTSARGRSHTKVASIYERLGQVYSGGQIAAAKRSQLWQMRPGDRVLYAGVGAGEDAAEAARLGAALTCLDLSAAMLARVERRLAAAGQSAELICGNAFEHARPGYYDIICANFFLNCLTEPAMRDMLLHLATLVRPGGKLLIADLAVPQGCLLARWFHRAYTRAANVIFWALGLVPLHPIYDYRRYFAAAGLRCAGERSFRLYGVGPVAYESLTAVRHPPESTSGPHAETPRRS